MRLSVTFELMLLVCIAVHLGRVVSEQNNFVLSQEIESWKKKHDLIVVFLLRLANCPQQAGTLS